jgi:sec-independent protein translocase protein TatC
MNLFEESKIFIKNILHWIYFFVGSSFFFFLFGLKKMMIFGKVLFLPLPSRDAYSLLFGKNFHFQFFSDNSLTIQIFNKIKFDLLPPNVQLIATNPVSAFISQIYLSVLLGFLLTIPFFFYKITVYLNPALLPREKKAVIWSLLSFVFLFFSGAMFSYLFLIPETFNILYPFTTSMGVVPFFSISEFIQYVFGLMIGVGVMFLLPIFMILFSFLGIIKADFWVTKWRFGVMFLLILSAIIAPDVITMIMLFIPLLSLYLVSCYFSKKFSRSV